MINILPSTNARYLKNSLALKIDNETICPNNFLSAPENYLLLARRGQIWKNDTI